MTPPNSSKPSQSAEESVSSGVEWGICPKTGLDQYPPPTWPDGNTRYRLCLKCRKRKPVSSFQPLYREQFHRPGVYRRRTCYGCEARKAQARRRKAQAKARVDAFDHATEEIRHVSTSEQIIGICERVAEELPGKDLEGLVKFWVEIIEAPKTSHRLRLTSVQTLAHMAVIAAQERLGEESRMDEINPVDFALRLQEQARLVPLIRALLADGVITLDDIDPPPA